MARSSPLVCTAPIEASGEGNGYRCHLLGSEAAFLPANDLKKEVFEVKESVLLGDGTKEPGSVDTSYPSPLPHLPAAPSQLTFIRPASLIEVA